MKHIIVTIIITLGLICDIRYVSPVKAMEHTQNIDEKQLIGEGLLDFCYNEVGDVFLQDEELPCQNSKNALFTMTMQYKIYEYNYHVEVIVEIKDLTGQAQISKLSGNAYITDYWYESLTLASDSRTVSCYGFPVGTITFYLDRDLYYGAEYNVYGDIYVTLLNGNVLNGNKLHFSKKVISVRP